MHAVDHEHVHPFCTKGREEYLTDELGRPFFLFFFVYSWCHCYKEDIMMDSLAGLIEVCKAKIYGTPVERAIDEEISISKAECKLAELSVDIQKASSKITDATVKATYTSAIQRIRSKQQP